MTDTDPSVAIDVRKGFRRAGSALFWLSASVVVALWAAQKAGFIALGVWFNLIAFVVLLIGFTASGVSRMIGMALQTAARSDVATGGSARINAFVEQLGWLPRLALSMLPGSNVLSAVSLLASVRDGTLAENMRGTFQMIGAVVGGGLMGVGGAAVTWQWWHGAGWAAAQGWLVICGIGAGLLALFMVVASWVADGFKPTGDGASVR